MPLFTPEPEFSDDYPTIIPSVGCNFANARALDGRIKFWRNSVATYIDRNGDIKTVGNHVARFDHDPDTGESLGLLIEEQRTNFIASSETTFGGTATGDFFRGKEIHNKTVNLNQFYFGSLFQNYSISAGDKYFLTGFIRAGSQTGSIGIGWIDGLNAPVPGVNSFTYTPTTDGEFVSFEFTFSQAFSGSCNCALNGSSGDDADFAIMQLEKGAFPTSYIPTDGATAVREEEEPQIDAREDDGDPNPYAVNNVDYYNPEEGTYLIEFRGGLLGDGDADATILSYATDGFDRQLMFSGTVDGNGASAPSETSIGYHDVTSLNGSDHTTSFKTAAFAYGGTTMSLSSNGNVVNGTWDRPQLNNADSGLVSIGHIAVLHRGLNGHVKRFYYYPKRLTDAQLQTLTQ